MTHAPHTVNSFSTGLVLNQPNQILKDDAFPVCLNAWTYLNTVRRRNGWNLINRLRRVLSDESLGVLGASPWSFNIYTALGITGEANAQIEIGSVVINLTTPTETFTDTGTGHLINLGVSNTVTGMTNGATTVVEFGVAPDSEFMIGRSVWLTGVSGWAINLQPIAITAVGATSITIAYDSTNDPAWSAGGVVNLYGGTIAYNTGAVTLIYYNGTMAPTITFNYFPCFPSMGNFDRDQISGQKSNVYFDTKYAYRLDQYSTVDVFEEFIPGFSWDWVDDEFPYYTNYWQVDSTYPGGAPSAPLGTPIFWVCNLTGARATAVPTRFTTGTVADGWVDFVPLISSTDTLYQAKALIPFRGMLIAFGTLEGTTAGTITGSTAFPNRVRASAIGSPFDTNAWNSVIPGKGYFEDLPTSEPIISAVPLGKTHVMIQTTSRTWVLTYTGSNLAPFRIDLVDDQLGGSSLWGNVNMGNSLVGIGNRLFQESSPNGVRANDEKIVNFVFGINRFNSGKDRVYSVRNYLLRMNSYIYPAESGSDFTVKFPNRRLIYNYENHSFAVFEDVLTSLGYFFSEFQLTWEKANFPWEQADIPWSFNLDQTPQTIGGNHQGYIGFIDSGVYEDESLFISDVTPVSGNAAVFTSPLYSLNTGTIVQLTGFINEYVGLNGLIASILRIDNDTFKLFQYDSSVDRFDDPVILETMQPFIGGAEVRVRHNFSIQTKAFNELEKGQSIHVTYLDTLTNVTENQTVNLNVYASLNMSNPINQDPLTAVSDGLSGNALSLSNPTTYPLSQINNRALINQRANTLSFEFTLSNATMAQENYTTPFQLSSWTLWKRLAGRPLMPLGGG